MPEASILTPPVKDWSACMATGSPGLLFTGYFAMSLAHTNEIIASTLNIFEEVLKVFRSGLSGKEGGNLKNLLEGEIVSPVFRKL